MYDPIADKVLVLGTFFLIFWGSYTDVSWIYFLLLVGRDAIMTLLRWRSVDEGIVTMETSLLAKSKTAVQFVCIILIFFVMWMQKEWGISLFWITSLLIYCCVLMSYLSFVGYIKSFLKG